MAPTAMATRRVDAGSEQVRSLEHVARRLRATCVRMAHDGHEGHLTSALSCIDLLVALYSGWLRYDPSDHAHPLRDRLLFSKGHAATALYAVYAHAGLVPPTSLAQYGRSGSPFPSHPCRTMLPQLEMSSGSLGHGLGMGTGIAYSLAMRNIDANVVVLMSDGECNEGSVWEAAAFARAHEQERLVAIVDNNNMQAVGRTDKLLGFTSFEEKFRAFGWHAVTIDGHDIRQILETLAQVPFSPRRPSAIIARTRGGRGVSFMEDDTLWHYRVPSAEDVERALAELGAEPLYEGIVRAAFRDTLLTLANRDERVIFLTADLGFGVFDTFIERFPTRYLNVGVAEAQLVDCAAGLALEGWRPIVYSIASFMTGRAWEQIRVAIGYHELPVVVVGAGGGYTYATSGVTHHAKEDLALMALIPGMAVLAPGDPQEVASLLPQLIDRPGPSYMRIGRFGEPTVASAAPIVVGKGRRLHEGNRVCLVSTGASMVQVDEAVRLLRERNMPVSAVHFHTLTPFDREAFDAATASSSTAIVVEEHGSRGGLAAAIAEHLVAGGRRMRVVRLGPDDGLVLGNPTPAELQRRLRYDTASIVAVAEEAWRLAPRQAGSEERPAVTA